MRFTAETPGSWNAKISPQLTCKGGCTYVPRKTIFWELKVLGCINYQIFLPTLRAVERHYKEVMVLSIEWLMILHKYAVEGGWFIHVNWTHSFTKFTTLSSADYCRLEKHYSLLVNGFKNAWCISIQKKVSEFFTIFENIGAKNSAVFISYKVTYLNSGAS